MCAFASIDHCTKLQGKGLLAPGAAAGSTSVLRLLSTSPTTGRLASIDLVVRARCRVPEVEDMDIEQGQVWEVYSARDRRWERAVVTKVDGAQATLRYEGLLEFLTVELSELQNNPELYRQAPEPDPPP